MTPKTRTRLLRRAARLATDILDRLRLPAEAVEGAERVLSGRLWVYRRGAWRREEM